MRNQVIVLDFGSPHTQLLARRIREQKVYCQVLDGDATPEEIQEAAGGDTPLAIILGCACDGGQGHPVVSLDPRTLSLGVPVLGIGYGMEAMVTALGGSVRGGGERGTVPLLPKPDSELFHGVEPGSPVCMEREAGVDTLPPGFRAEGATHSTSVAAISGGKLYGVAFHPEVESTVSGTAILRNFLFRIANLEPQWTVASFVERSVADIRRRVGDAHVIGGVSGGVDSTVAAVLVHRAIGHRFHPILVDNGLLRKDEAAHVQDLMSRLGIRVQLAQAEDRFLDALCGVADPEEKRKIIGREFIGVFEQEAAKIQGARFILQGTIYADILESGSRVRGVVKSHHNVGGLPEKMNLLLLEPLRELFKDEVRELGVELGLSREFVWRHPFPGPGLGVRVLGEVTRDRVEIVRQAQAILDQEIRNAGWYHKLWQCFCVLPDVRTVGVLHDKRTYGHVLAIRAVCSIDAMTASWAHLPHDLLEIVSRRITSEVSEVNRVVLDITSKPPATIEWE